MTLFKYNGADISVYHSIDQTTSPDRFVLHAHRNCELYYFISGEGYYTVEGNDYELSPGCLLAMRSGEVHTPHIRPDKPYERICINFPLSAFPLISTELGDLFLNRPLGKNNRLVPGEESARFISDCMARICRESPEDRRYTQVYSNLLPLLLELYHVQKRTEFEDKPCLIPSAQGSSEIVARIIEYINANLTTIRNLDDLGQEFFFSKSYLNRIFKESTGSSVWDYIVLKRLLLSRTLLQEGKQANIVASECGFCDYSSFYRQFKQRFGISPLAARKNKNSPSKNS